MTISRTRLLDILWLLALMAFVLAGMTLVSFHGDEAMQIYMSGDFATTFIDRDLQRLSAGPPYFIDEDNWLRILNGTVTRQLIGLSWHIAGLSDDMRPDRPGWDWGLDYDRNVETGHRPPDAMLYAARLVSTLFLTFSVPLMFALGTLFGGRPAAYFASAVYTLNPVVLLNGRRAMMEGALLFFGILTVLIAAVIVYRREQGKRISWAWWLGLILASGFAVASKHSGATYVAAAFGGLFIAELLSAWRHRRWRGLVFGIPRLAVCGLLSVALFVVLSPALWSDPIARLQDLVIVRSDLIDLQVQSYSQGPLPISQRLTGMVMQPFMTAPEHFEVAAWATFAPITAEIERYMASPLSGLQFGLLLGLPLTLLAGFGALSVWIPRLRPRRSWGLSFALWAWLAAAMALILANPLPWQRYFLPFIPAAAILAGIGFKALLCMFERFCSETPTLAPDSLAGSQDVSETTA